MEGGIFDKDKLIALKNEITPFAIDTQGLPLETYLENQLTPEQVRDIELNPSRTLDTYLNRYRHEIYRQASRPNSPITVCDYGIGGGETQFNLLNAIYHTDADHVIGYDTLWTDPTDKTFIDVVEKLPPFITDKEEDITDDEWIARFTYRGKPREVRINKKPVDLTEEVPEGFLENPEIGKLVFSNGTALLPKNLLPAVRDRINVITFSDEMYTYQQSNIRSFQEGGYIPYDTDKLSNYLKAVSAMPGQNESRSIQTFIRPGLLKQVDHSR